MSFEQEGWARTSVSYNQDAPRGYNYESKTDNLATILAPNYFVSQTNVVALNTIINIVATDENRKVRVTLIDPVQKLLFVGNFVQATSQGSSPIFVGLTLTSLESSGQLMFTLNSIDGPDIVNSPNLVFDGVNNALIIGGDLAAKEASAKLELLSITQGFLPPRMTDTERDAIASPASGLMIFNITTGKFNGREPGAWRAFTTTAV